jgi:hypothetical protein
MELLMVAVQFLRELVQSIKNKENSTFDLKVLISFSAFETFCGLFQASLGEFNHSLVICMRRLPHIRGLFFSSTLSLLSRGGGFLALQLLYGHLPAITAVQSYSFNSNFLVHPIQLLSTELLHCHSQPEPQHL